MVTWALWQSGFELGTYTVMEMVNFQQLKVKSIFIPFFEFAMTKIDFSLIGKFSNNALVYNVYRYKYVNAFHYIHVRFFVNLKSWSTLSKSFLIFHHSSFVHVLNIDGL